MSENKKGWLRESLDHIDEVLFNSNNVIPFDNSLSDDSVWQLYILAQLAINNNNKLL